MTALKAFEIEINGTLEKHLFRNARSLFAFTKHTLDDNNIRIIPFQSPCPTAKEIMCPSRRHHDAIYKFNDGPNTVTVREISMDEYNAK